ncbi:MAG TPA: WbqC family protein [Geobacteraceae bacterium]|nr:WbqC family protein [Geobacteraceae bacterium]
MIVSIHQPSYWPWLGLLDKIAKSDLFVLLDNVQLNKDSYQRRNIFLAGNSEKYLTIPIDYFMGVKINEARIKDETFPRKHYETLRGWYMKSPFFAQVEELICPLYQRHYETLIEIAMETMLASLEAFGIKTRVMLASELDAAGAKGELVLNICKAVNATSYLSGKGALQYFQERDFVAFSTAGIEVVFQQFTHPVYAQYGAQQFIPGLGCLDYLFNCGCEQGKNVFPADSSAGNSA